LEHYVINVNLVAIDFAADNPFSRKEHSET
jgi:hypothetical protein